VFREIKEGLLQPLLLLFWISLNSGQLLRPWKEVTVTPSFKKGFKTLPTNYCSVSLTSIVCKILETIVKEHIMNYFSVKNFNLIMFPIDVYF